VVGSSFQVMRKVVGFIELSSQTLGSSFQVMRKVVGFMKLYSIPFGSGGTEWSVPVFISRNKSLDSQNGNEYRLGLANRVVEPQNVLTHGPCRQAATHDLHEGLHRRWSEIVYVKIVYVFFGALNVSYSESALCVLHGPVLTCVAHDACLGFRFGLDVLVVAGGVGISYSTSMVRQGEGWSGSGGASWAWWLGGSSWGQTVHGGAGRLGGSSQFTAALDAGPNCLRELARWSFRLGKRVNVNNLVGASGGIESGAGQPKYLQEQRASHTRTPAQPPGC